MAENDVEVKIAKLKRIYKNPIDQRDLGALEEKLRQTITKKRFARNAVVQEIIGETVRKIKELSYLLAWDERATPEERNSYFTERKVHMFWLERIDGTVAQKMIAQMESSVDNKLNEY